MSIHCPIRLQTDERESGAVALGMAMAAHGVDLLQEALNEECSIARDGSRISNMVWVAKNHKFEVSTEEGVTPAALAKLPMPAVIGWGKAGCFATCLGRKIGMWTIHDPQDGSKTLDEGAFAAAFTGVVLTLVPGKGFKRVGGEPSFFNSLMPFIGCCMKEGVLLVVIGLLLVPLKLLQPNMDRFLLDYFFVNEYVHWGLPLVVLGLLLVVLLGLGNGLWGFTSIMMQVAMSVKNGMAFMRTLFTLKASFFQSRLAGDIAQRVDYITEVSLYVGYYLADNLLSMVSVVCFGALLVTYDRVLGMVAIMLGVGVIIALVSNLARCRTLTGAAQRQRAKMLGIATHGITMMETIKASGQEDEFFAEWSDLFLRVQRANMDMTHCTQFLSIVPQLAQNIGTTIIVGVGALRILDGGMSSGTYIAFQLVLGCFLTPMSWIVETFSQQQRIYVYASLVLDVIRHPSAHLANKACCEESDKVVRKLDGVVELRDITFGYNRNDPPVLEHFNLTIAAGERVAIVGLSGSGKSTVAGIISGANEPWSGDILFDGIPRGDYSAEELRYSFAMVDQEIVMLPGTVGDNIRMFDEAISFEAVKRAAEDAMIHDSIISRPGGYQAELNSQGTDFSGGERQRMEIARALSIEPSILLLDEATSALDPAIEEKLDLNLRRRGVTTIVIAHRLSTIRDADRIVVMKQGKIAELGTHDELLKLNGIYSELVSA